MPAIKKKFGKKDLFIEFCKQQGLPSPVPEFRFHPKRRWRIDYYFEHEGRKVALEVEGGVWVGGRHVYPGSFLKDMDKYNELSAHGIFLVRTVPKSLFSLRTIKMLKRCLNITEEKAMQKK